MRELIYLRQLLRDLRQEQRGPIIIYMDNRNIIMLMNDPISNMRTKYIDINYHFIRERVEVGEVTLRYINMNDMVIDYMTKTVGDNVIQKTLPKLFGSIINNN